MKQRTLRAAGHFRVLIDHSLRPYEPTPTHLLKRMLIPLCEDLRDILIKGTKNDAWELLHNFSEACRRIQRENQS